jgi:peroxiredoxin
LRSFQQRLVDFDSRGIRVVGISIDPPEINQRQSQKLGYTFPLLSDPEAKIIRRYDVLHPQAGPKGALPLQERRGRTRYGRAWLRRATALTRSRKGADVARPAEFLLDANGIVRWVNLTENIAVRARPEQVLQAFSELQSAGQ